MLYTLNLYSAVWQVYHNKTGHRGGITLQFTITIQFLTCYMEKMHLRYFLKYLKTHTKMTKSLKPTELFFNGF